MYGQTEIIDNHRFILRLQRALRKLCIYGVRGIFGTVFVFLSVSYRYII